MVLLPSDPSHGCNALATASAPPAFPAALRAITCTSYSGTPRGWFKINGIHSHTLGMYASLLLVLDVLDEHRFEVRLFS